MSYVISLKLKSETHQRFQDIFQQLNQGQSESVAKALGEVPVTFGGGIMIQNESPWPDGLK